MKKYLNVKGVDFELCKEKIFDLDFKAPDVYKCYKQCSMTKCNIWESWKQFFSNLQGFKKIGVLSSSLDFFTIGVVTENYVFIITKGHKRVYERK